MGGGRAVLAGWVGGLLPEEGVDFTAGHAGEEAPAGGTGLSRGGRSSKALLSRRSAAASTG